MAVWAWAYLQYAFAIISHPLQLEENMASLIFMDYFLSGYLVSCVLAKA